MTRSPDPDPLFTLPNGPRMSPGPVYQGVSKQIREQIAAGAIDRDLDAGAIAAARSAARSVDWASGHNPDAKVSGGMQLAPLHAALLAWLEQLRPDIAETDEFAELVKQMQETPGGHAAPSHPEV